MLRKTHAIVLRSYIFQEKGWIVKVFTDQLGVITFYAAKGRGKGKKSTSLFQPLTQLEITFNYKEKSEMQSIREAVNVFPYKNIQGSPLRSAIGIFMAEVMYRAAREESPSSALFDLLCRSAQALDDDAGPHPDLALIMLLELTGVLGIKPTGMTGDNIGYFSIADGLFRERQDTECLNHRGSAMLNDMLGYRIDDMPERKLNLHDRRILIRALLKYMRIHHPGFGEVQSHLILEQLSG